MLFESNEWHPEKQWLIEAVAEDGQTKTFALAGIHNPNDAKMENLLRFVAPALLVLRNMCRTAKLDAGERKATEMIDACRAYLCDDAKPSEAEFEGRPRLRIVGSIADAESGAEGKDSGND